MKFYIFYMRETSFFIHLKNEVLLLQITPLYLFYYTMGIKDLTQFIKKIYGDVFHKLSLLHFIGKRLGVDISIFIYRFKAMNGDNWFKSFIYFIISLKKAGINPLFVYDGKGVPSEKQEETVRRASQKNKLKEKYQRMTELIEKYEESKTVSEELQEIFLREYNKQSPTNLIDELVSAPDFDIQLVRDATKKVKNQIISIKYDDVDTSKRFMDLCGIDYITAPGEGEVLCAALCKSGKIDGVISEDSDVLACGGKVFIKIDNKGSCNVIYLEELLKAMELTYEEFLDFCILCSCDFNRRIPKVGPVKALKLIKTHKKLEGLEDLYNTECLRYKRCREIFSDTRGVEEVCLEEKKVGNIEGLKLFLEESGLQHMFSDIVKACDLE
jgi:5'-3' exonuclease